LKTNSWLALGLGTCPLISILFSASANAHKDVSSKEKAKDK